MTSLPHCGSAGGDALRRLFGAIGSKMQQSLLKSRKNKIYKENEHS